MKVISETVAGIDFSLLGNVPRTFVPWSPEIEIVEAATFDIGVMPVPGQSLHAGQMRLQGAAIHGPGNPRGLQPGRRQSGHHPRRTRRISSREAATIGFKPLPGWLKDPFLRETIGHAGRRRVEEAFSLKLHGPRLVQAVEKRTASAPQVGLTAPPATPAAGSAIAGPPPNTEARAVPRGP